MSALWRDDEAGEALGRRLVPMELRHLDAVTLIENAAYAFPWSRGNFVDSVVAGYPSRVLLDATGTMLGYFIAMAGVDEMHLLNITVAPAVQGRGHARHMLAALVELCAQHAARELWLEVRLSNSRARAIYERLGLPVWMPHGTRGDFGDFSEAGWTRLRPNWIVTPYDTGALPHFEKPEEFMRDYARFLAEADALVAGA